MKRIVVIPDCHVPDHDKRATNNVFTFIRDFTPDLVLWLGDLYDFKPVARWSKATVEECGDLMQREADAGDKFFAEFRDAYKGESLALRGNHELRWSTYLAKYAPGINGMEALRLESVFHYDKYSIPIVPQPYRLTASVVAIHGDKLSHIAGSSAMKEVARHGKSIVQGHSHRAGIVYQTTDRRRFGMECGWLGDIKKASYLAFTGVGNWQQAFGLLSVDGNHVIPELVPVQSDGSFIVRGKRYG